VNLRRRAAQLKWHTAFHQVRDEFFVRIAGCHIPFGVVRLVVQSHWPAFVWKTPDHLSLGVPVGDVVLDELKVEDRSCRSLRTSRKDTEGNLHFATSLNIDVKWFP